MVAFLNKALAITDVDSESVSELLKKKSHPLSA